MDIMLADETHNTLFKYIRNNIYNNLDVEQCNELQIKSMGQFEAVWVLGIAMCIANWPPYQHSEIMKFSIVFFEPGKIQLHLHQNSNKDQVFSPAFSDIRKNLAEVVN
jgi:hypothetical protein